MKQKHFNLAIKDFEAALKLRPNHVESHLKLGLIYLYNLNDETNALIHLREVLKLDPNHPHASQIREAISFLSP